MRTGENPKFIKLVVDAVNRESPPTWAELLDEIKKEKIPTSKEGVYFRDPDGGVIFRCCRDYARGLLPSGPLPYVAHSPQP